MARRAQKFRQPETGQLTARPKPQESMEILKVFLFEGKRKQKIEAKSAPEAKGRSQAGCSEAKAPPQPLQSQFSLPSPRLPSARFASAWAAFKSLGLQQAALDRPSARGGAAQPKPGRQRCAFCSAESMAGVCAGPGGRGRAPGAAHPQVLRRPTPRRPGRQKAPLKQACAATYEQADARASKPTPRRSGAGCGTARGGGRLLLFSGGKANGRGPREAHVALRRAACAHPADQWEAFCEFFVLGHQEQVAARLRRRDSLQSRHGPPPP